MKKPIVLLCLLLVALLSGCTPAQRANCGVCRFLDGLWHCPTPPDANASEGDAK